MPEPMSSMSSRTAAPCVAKLLAVIAALLLAAGPMAVLAQGPSASSPSKSATAQANKSSAPTSLDALKTPAGAIVVICDKAAEGFHLVPRGILLAPESYQQLLDQIEQLKNKLQKTARTPAVCTLSGRVDGAVVQLEAEFEFTTSQPRSLVNLGCQRALPKSATLDGQLPVLSSSDDGLVVQVEKPGVHRLTLGLEASWSARVAKAGERSFDVGLPRAAITRLKKFEVPAGVTNVQVSGRSVSTRPSTGGRRETEAVLLGAADRLEVSWKAPAVSAVQDRGQPLTATDAVVSVRVDESQVTTDAEITLRVLRGKVATWQLRVPFDTHADLKVSDDRTHVVQPADARNPLVTIEREPGADPVIVHLRSRQPRHGATVVPGPWYLLGALRQQGTITISATPELRVQVHPHSEVLVQEVPDSKRTDAIASFSYWNLPTPPEAPLAIEVGTLKGWLTARTSHTLRLDPETGWQLTTQIEAVPIRTGVDHLDVAVPAGLQLQEEGIDVSPPEALAEKPHVGKEKGRQVLTIPLVRRQRSPFTVTLTGTYPLSGRQRQVALGLPRPLAAQDRGGQLQVELPAGQELVPPENEPERWSPGTREYTWRSEHAPTRAVLSWRAYRPDLAANIDAHVTLLNGRGWVREYLRFPKTAQLPRPLWLNVPAELRGHVDLAGDNRPLVLTADGRVDGSDSATTERVLTLSYSFTVPDASGSDKTSRPFVVPIIRPREASRLDTRVFFYTEPGTRPVVEGSAWDEERIEATSEAALPTLVVHGRSVGAPLMVREAPTGAANLAGLFVERALIQVAVDGAGGQIYHARFVTARPATRRLEIEFPGPVAALNAHVFVQGKEVQRFLPSSDDRQLAFDLVPDPAHDSYVIAVRYQLDAGAVRRGLFQTALEPPVLHGQVLMGPMRWEVSLPPGWVPLYEGGYGAEQAWEWHGLLWVPRPAATTDELEHWLHAPVDVGTAASSFDLRHNSVVCWGAPPESLAIWHVPQAAWLLACSVVFLALGLGALYVPLPRVVLGPVLVLLGVAIAAAALLWPGVLPLVVYGCEPGLVAFVIILLVQALLHRRYQRQVTSLPAFSRAKAGSSLVRTVRPSLPHGEPSTVDVPLAPGPSEPPLEALPRLESSSHK